MGIFKLKRAAGYTSGIASLLLLAAAGPAAAATITVNSAADPGGVGDSECTLREAIANANELAATNADCEAGDGADTIEFAANVAGGTINMADTGFLTLDADDSLTINGAGTTINANGASTDGGRRIFNNATTLTLNNLTLTGGVATDRNGGAIINAAALIINNSTLSNNIATGTGGAGQGSGGAIFNTGDGSSVTITDSTLTRNTADRAGGAIEDNSGTAVAITLNNVTANNNNTGVTAPGAGFVAAIADAPGNGGVLHISGAGGVSITGGSYSNNLAANEGGALWNGGGTMTVDDTSVTNNAANGADASEGGGGLFNEGGTLTLTEVTITGNSATGSAATPAAQGSGGGILNNGGTLTVTDSTISNNSSVRAGGGIEDDSREIQTVQVTLNNVTMDANTTGGNPGNGGAVHISGAGTMNVNGGSFTNNVAANEGGGLWNFGTATMTIDGATITSNQGNGAGPANGGGGLFNNGGTMNVANATVSNNVATTGSGSGGGILNAGSGTLSVTDSTISGNTANRAGGGIETGSPDTTGSSVVLTNVLLTNNHVNTSPGNGGGLHAGTDGTVTVTNSIVTNNRAGLEGGGLWVNNGALTISGTRISGNDGQGNRVTTDSNGAAVPASGGGGGIVINGTSTATISANTLISQNLASGTAGSGGGIFNKAGGTVNVTDSIIAANSSNRAGGGIENDGGTVTLTRVGLGGLDSSASNIAGSSPGNGGGLHTGGAGVVTIDDSAIAFNTASEGGGLWNSGAGTLTVNNSTVSNNQATVTTGGGIHQDGDGGTTNLSFATIARNSAQGNGGGIAAPGASTVEASSSIVAENSSAATGADTSGTVTLTDSTTGADAGLDDYQLFGGTTATHPITASSPAATDGDARECFQAPINNTDQRGAARGAVALGFAGDCDAGAFEISENPVISVTNNSDSSVSVPSGGADNVEVLAFTLTNNSGGNVTINGVSGVADASVPGLEPSNFRVFAGTSGNALANAAVEIDGRSFTVTFDGDTGIVFGDGQTTSYSIQADFTAADGGAQASAAINAPVFAGGVLVAMLGLFSVGGLRRRTRWALLIAAVSVGLAACGGGGGGSSGGNGGGNDGGQPPPMVQNADLQFIAVTVDGNDANDGEFIVGDGMPLPGPVISFGS